MEEEEDSWYHSKLENKELELTTNLFVQHTVLVVVVFFCCFLATRHLDERRSAVV